MDVNPDQHQATFTCTQCARTVTLRLGVLVPTAGGALEVQAEPLVTAMALHMRVGCEAT